MDCQAREIIVLKNDEFKMLLGAAGIDEWYGIALNKAEHDYIDERSFNEILAALYQKHIINWGESKAYIDNRYRPLMRVLKNASRCLTAISAYRPGYIKGSYFSYGNVAVIERRTGSPDELEISLLPFSEWADELAKDYCPEILPPSQDANSIDFEGVLISEFELRCLPDGELKQTARLYESGLYGVLELDDGINKVKKLFSRDMLIDFLQEWAGGNE